MTLSPSAHKLLQYSSALIVTFLLSTNVLADKHAKKHSSHEMAEVYIIEPLNGAVVSSTFTVKFGLKGMNVAPAGSEMKNSGHHHLLIDSDEIPKKGMPMGSNVEHFGKGQTETKLTLDKGVHTLQLIIGDKSHMPLANMLMSKAITITVD